MKTMRKVSTGVAVAMIASLLVLSSGPIGSTGASTIVPEWSASVGDGQWITSTVSLADAEHLADEVQTGGFGGTDPYTGTAYNEFTGAGVPNATAQTGLYAGADTTNVTGPVAPNPFDTLYVTAYSHKAAGSKVAAAFAADVPLAKKLGTALGSLFVIGGLYYATDIHEFWISASYKSQADATRLANLETEYTNINDLFPPSIVNPNGGVMYAETTGLLPTLGTYRHTPRRLIPTVPETCYSATPTEMYTQVPGVTDYQLEPVSHTYRLLSYQCPAGYKQTVAPKAPSTITCARDTVTLHRTGVDERCPVGYAKVGTPAAVLACQVGGEQLQAELTIFNTVESPSTVPTKADLDSPPQNPAIWFDPTVVPSSLDTNPQAPYFIQKQSPWNETPVEPWPGEAGHFEFELSTRGQLELAIGKLPPRPYTGIAQCATVK